MQSRPTPNWLHLNAVVNAVGPSPVRPDLWPFTQQLITRLRGETSQTQPNLAEAVCSLELTSLSRLNPAICNYNLKIFTISVTACSSVIHCNYMGLQLSVLFSHSAFLNVQSKINVIFVFRHIMYV